MSPLATEYKLIHVTKVPEQLTRQPLLFSVHATGPACRALLLFNSWVWPGEHKEFPHDEPGKTPGRRNGDRRPRRSRRSAILSQPAELSLSADLPAAELSIPADLPATGLRVSAELWVPTGHRQRRHRHH